MQESFGGTWWTFIAIPASAPTATCTRSAIASSRGEAHRIATGRAEILAYVGEVIEENRPGAPHPLRHKILSARWLSESPAVDH